jgi:hypothetical protein
MNLHALITDFNECAFTILWTSHPDPAICSSESSGLEWNGSYALPLLGRYVDCVNNSLNNDINPIGVGSADVVAKLRMAKRKSVLRRAQLRERGWTDKLGILKGKNRRLAERMRDSVG